MSNRAVVAPYHRSPVKKVISYYYFFCGCQHFHHCYFCIIGFGFVVFFCLANDYPYLSYKGDVFVTRIVLIIQNIGRFRVVYVLFYCCILFFFSSFLVAVPDVSRLINNLYFPLFRACAMQN